MKKFWLSFCDPKKEKGSQFLGVSIVDAVSFIQAVEIARFLGCNPGGEVQGFEIPSCFIISKKWMGRLLTKLECEELEKEIGDKQ